MSLTASVDLPWLHSPLCSIPVDMRHLSGPNFIRQDPDFTTTYQLLGTGMNVTDFHIQDGLLCHLGHLCVPAREHAKMIWEAHYSQDGRTFWRGENYGHSTKTFLLAKTSTRCQQVYHILHCLCHFQANHQEERLIHPSSYSQEALGIHLDGLHVCLPSTKQGNDCVFVVVDWFSKMAILTAYKKSITVTDTTKIFFE
jgi:hypothetical protein